MIRTDTDHREEPQGRSFAEHLVFVLLLLPTFLVLAAAVVSLAHPEPIAIEKPLVAVAACEPCPAQDGDDGP